MEKHLDKLNHVSMMKYSFEYINQYIDHIVENNNYNYELVDRNRNNQNWKILIEILSNDKYLKKKKTQDNFKNFKREKLTCICTNFT